MVKVREHKHLAPRGKRIQSSKMAFRFSNLRWDHSFCAENWIPSQKQAAWFWDPLIMGFLQDQEITLCKLVVLKLCESGRLEQLPILFYS